MHSRAQPRARGHAAERRDAKFGRIRYPSKQPSLAAGRARATRAGAGRVRRERGGRKEIKGACGAVRRGGAGGQGREARPG